MPQASNQFFPTLPTLPGTGARAGGGSGLSVPGAGGGFSISPQNSPYNPYTTDVGGGYRAGSTLNPNETSAFTGYLLSQIGKGATPFNLQTTLPGGGKTAPGQLTAGLDPIMKILQQFFQSGGTKGGFPGMTDLTKIAHGTAPEQSQLEQVSKYGISAVQPWQAMVDAMQRQIGQGRADLSESLNVGGGLVGSPYGTAMTDYDTQSNKDLMSILSQMQFQGIQEQLGAGEALVGQKSGAAGALMGEGTDFGKFMQGLDQESIQNMMQEFIRTRPEYNPLIPQMGQVATTFPPFMGNKTSTNPLAGLIPGAAQGLGAGIGAAAGGAGAGASSVAGLLAMLSAL
jgi:hypothetical protein